MFGNQYLLALMAIWSEGAVRHWGPAPAELEMVNTCLLKEILHFHCQAWSRSYLSAHFEVSVCGHSGQNCLGSCLRAETLSLLTLGLDELSQVVTTWFQLYQQCLLFSQS